MTKSEQNAIRKAMEILQNASIGDKKGEQMELDNLSKAIKKANDDFLEKIRVVAVANGNAEYVEQTANIKAKGAYTRVSNVFKFKA